MTAAQFRLDAPGRDTLSGPADVQVTGGALVVAPAGGDQLRIPFAQITSLTQNAAYTVQLALSGGARLELARMGAMTTQLLAELRDGRADAIAAALRPVGPAEVFSGYRGADAVELRVHDDALLVIGDAAGERVAFSFVSAVHVEEYVVTVERAGRPPLYVSRLGRRTGEFAELLGGRLSGGPDPDGGVPARAGARAGPGGAWARRPGCCATASRCRPGCWTRSSRAWPGRWPTWPSARSAGRRWPGCGSGGRWHSGSGR